MKDISYDDLDEGIRETIKFLRDKGFDATDLEDSNICISIENPSELILISLLLLKTLKDAGIEVQPIGGREEYELIGDMPSEESISSDPEGVEIQASFDPAANSAVIIIIGLDDDKLASIKQSLG